MSVIETGPVGPVEVQEYGQRESSLARRYSRPWQEMVADVQLGNVQRITAQKVLLTQVVQDFWLFSKEVAPSLRDHDRSQPGTTLFTRAGGKSKNELISAHTAGLMDEFRAREGIGTIDDPIHDPLAQTHLDTDDMKRLLDARKRSILETAKHWSEADALRVRHDLDKVIKKLHPEQKVLIREQEEIESLAERQRLAADMTFASYVIRRASEQAKQELPFLKSKEQHRRSVQIGTDQPQPSDGLQVQYVDSFLNAYRYRELEASGVNFRTVRTLQWGEEPQNDAELYKFKLTQMGEDADYMLGQVDGLRDELKGVKEQIATDSSTWNEIDIANALKDTRYTIRKLPKDQQELLEKRTGISPRTFQEFVKEWALPVGGTALHYATSEGIIAGLAAWVSTREVVMDTLPETARTEYLGATWAGLQFVWYYLMSVSAKKQLATLQIDGENLNALAKGAYNLAHDMSDTKKLYRPERKKTMKKIASAVTPDFITDFVNKVGPEKLAVGVGHIGPQALVDITYTLSAIAGMKAGYLDLDQAFVLGCVANALGGAVEGGYILGQKYLQRRRMDQLHMVPGEKQTDEK